MEYQFKIQIKGITKPPVWRQVVVPASYTFSKFHKVIQRAFGWDNYHLFEFRDREYNGRIRIAIPSDDDYMFDVETWNANRVKLSQVFSGGFDKMQYLYDYGDYWVHEIKLEAVTEGNRRKAVCLAGKGVCPPEDCGGIFGYEAMKECFRTEPNGEEANSYRSWLAMEKEEVWDAGHFDLEETNLCLEYV